MPEISVVIPSLNEEEYLPILLESLKKQTFRDFEVIVADAGSKDKTVDIAKEYGAKVVAGGMPGPGRNRGAEVASGDFLFFFDSDVYLPPDFLEKAYQEMQDRFLDLATCEFKPQSDLQLDKVMFKLANLTVKLNQSFNPRAAGFCIFITRRLFRRVKGFDESVVIAEDHDLVDRASKFRPLRFLNNVHLTVSIRRLEKEGRFALLEKYFHVEMHLLTKGSVKEDIIEYEFGNFGKDDKKVSKKILDDLEKNIIQLEERYNQFSTGIKSGIGEIQATPESWKQALDSVTDSFRNLFKKEKK
ncbi:glycosyl transferase family 2 [Leptospira ryugenii]|uniref:Glycosyl transferase family 2 n=1 Tax=Leptospira ryugenii TaxID=1917863 RepID=A0A2P2E107_9LEPT|nr:glycosyltransferase [Leptospira ryugenii]GBF50486.1 glycosyl transferase family 2 [Leptospira ryugenii]